MGQHKLKDTRNTVGTTSINFSLRPVLLVTLLLARICYQVLFLGAAAHIRLPLSIPASPLDTPSSLDPNVFLSTILALMDS